MHISTKKGELAWAAGFLDGEGNFGCSRLKRKFTTSYVFNITAMQIDRRPLDRLASILGGSVTGPYKSSGLGTKMPYSWTVGGFPRGQAVVAAMWSFMSEPKQEQARLALGMYLTNFRSKIHPQHSWCKICAPEIYQRVADGVSQSRRKS